MVKNERTQTCAVLIPFAAPRVLIPPHSVFAAPRVLIPPHCASFRVRRPSRPHSASFRFFRITNRLRDLWSGQSLAKVVLSSCRLVGFQNPPLAEPPRVVPRRPPASVVRVAQRELEGRVESKSARNARKDL